MNNEQEKARLLHLHNIALQARFEKDARAFLAAYASQWYDVRATGIRLRTKEEALPAIDQYFQRIRPERGAPSQNFSGKLRSRKPHLTVQWGKLIKRKIEVDNTLRNCANVIISVARTDQPNIGNLFCTRD